ncbi:AMP-binding protein [Hamadaea sp. NPDC051192]|uniref:AMP-binding protein n=1 Tax=Hamadaea sp. NPDC051192 TaxID=3154940 RepID=UPI0034352B66
MSRARSTPDVVAMVEGDGSHISYGDLAARVRQLAGALRDNGVGDGTRVGLWMGEGSWIAHATGYFAAMHAGAVAVVLPTDASQRALRQICDDAGPVLVLSDKAADISWTDAPALPVTISSVGDPAGPDTAGSPPGLADVIFTSGSTGLPKGVATSHEALARMAERYRARSGGAAVVGHALSHATAIGRQVLLAAVARGATVVSCVPFQPDRFLRLSAVHGVGTAVLPAALGRALRIALEADPAAAPARLRRLRFVSDQLRPEVHRGLADLLPKTAIVNTYGLTEGGDAHLVVTADDCDLGPGGYPAPGTEVRVMLHTGEWAPQGDIGVVCIRDGNFPLTYLTEPFRAQLVWHDGWTRTGDLGMIDANGRVHITGRIEAHARIGGHTVALSTVQRALEEHPLIDSAAVIAVAHPSLGQSLAAVVEARAELDSAQVRAFLAGSVPDYAVPSPAVVVRAIPLSRNGKPLREAIERIVTDRRTAEVEPCRTELEKAVGAIWAELLETDRPPGRNESFHDLGGDSVAAVQVLMRVEELTGRDVPPEALTMSANLAEFAAAVEQLEQCP